MPVIQNYLWFNLNKYLDRIKSPLSVSVSIDTLNALLVEKVT